MICSRTRPERPTETWRTSRSAKKILDGAKRREEGPANLTEGPWSSARVPLCRRESVGRAAGSVKPGQLRYRVHTGC
jgi:hypothetical protein